MAHEMADEKAALTDRHLVATMVVLMAESMAFGLVEKTDYRKVVEKDCRMAAK